MADSKAYDDIIMDHIKHARGYRVLDDATGRAVGANPMCGDDLVVYVRVDAGRIADVSFQCTCCGISMASASIMTDSLRGRNLADARAASQKMVHALTTRADPAQYSDPAHQALLKTAQELPSRIRCAALAWATLEAALDNRTDTVSVP